MSGQFKLFRFEEEWEYAKSPKAKRAAKKLMDAAVAYVEDKGPLPDIELFADALNSGGSVVPIWAFGVLNRVLKEHPNPLDYSLAVYHAGNAAARGWMMRFFRISRRPNVKKQIVMLGLSDKSARVRLWACEADCYGKDPELADKLRQLAISDPNAEVREVARWRLKIVTHGYCLERVGRRVEFDMYDEKQGCSDGFCVPKAGFEKYGEEALFAMFKENRFDPRLKSSSW